MDLAKQAQIVDSIHDTLSDFVGQKHPRSCEHGSF